LNKTEKKNVQEPPILSADDNPENPQVAGKLLKEERMRVYAFVLTMITFGFSKVVL
jgi:CheY-like chemotaxis protein